MRLVRYGILAVIILTLVITILAYPELPDQIPSHWNFEGEVDGYLPKLWGALVIPLVMIPFTALFFLLPRIDPLKENYRKFQGYYEGFILVFAVFLFTIQLQILLWGLGYPISPTLLLPLTMGALYLYLGFLVEHAEQNWFVGIRTPWTLSSEQVWKKTHALGGTLFKIAGIIAMIGVFFGEYSLWFTLVPILIVAAYMVIYSYLEYRKEKGTTG
ncbi:MAG: DUF1648 domain-containing protein [Methanoregulaceae archaeon]|jgi:uncharacterized membrane protein|nr:DUF1648 domain-containing protein [Methanoregulaceae archaeon]MCU0628163.1 DUF1648 domain-containing protein [Methanoregulaceae archaeon]